MTSEHYSSMLWVAGSLRPHAGGGGSRTAGHYCTIKLVVALPELPFQVATAWTW